MTIKKIENQEFWELNILQILFNCVLNVYLFYLSLDL